jgi:hypothetical protein
VNAPASVNAVLRALLAARPPSLGSQVAKVWRHLCACRTGALGYTLWQCDDCHTVHPLPNGCGDRHCPTCQHARTTQWLERQRRDLLPVRYYHWVFTLPALLRPLALQNPQALYRLLLDAAAASLLQLGRERFDGATLGLTLVLHTWGQNLGPHPHAHGLVTGGGLTPDGRWCGPAQERWLLDVHQVGARFRDAFLAGLERLFTSGALQFHGQLAPLAQPQAFYDWLRPLRRHGWVVFAKGSVAGPEAVLQYLGRYSHRVALANGRLLAFDPATGRVTFRYKDYADHDRQKSLTLPGHEFLRRWAMHVLPAGFTKIRHYGLLASNQRHRLIPQARAALQHSSHRWQPKPPPPPKPRPVPLCPHCRGVHLRCVARLNPNGTIQRRFNLGLKTYLDSS